MTAADSPAVPDTYIAAISVSDLFVDPTYQRELDEKKAKAMSLTWDRRLVGVLDVSDRGIPAPGSLAPRFAIVNGQHRWAAASLIDEDMNLVCTVHTGLTVAQEAKLFWDIDRKTTALSTWDRWYARRASGEHLVLDIERIAAECGLAVTQNPGPKNVQCASALEFIYDRYLPDVLADTLVLVGDVWPGDTDGRRAPVLKAVAAVHFHYALTLDTGRLADALSTVTPRQLQARARDLMDRGTHGSLATVMGVVIVQLYNNRRAASPRLDLAVISS